MQLNIVFAILGLCAAVVQNGATPSQNTQVSLLASSLTQNQDTSVPQSVDNDHAAEQAQSEDSSSTLVTDQGSVDTDLTAQNTQWWVTLIILVVSLIASCTGHVRANNAGGNTQSDEVSFAMALISVIQLANLICWLTGRGAYLDRIMAAPEEAEGRSPCNSIDGDDSCEQLESQDNWIVPADLALMIIHGLFLFWILLWPHCVKNMWDNDENSTTSWTFALLILVGDVCVWIFALYSS